MKHSSGITVRSPDSTIATKDRLDAALRAIGFIVWFSFILLCVGLGQSHGLCCADDARLAVIAKSLASGLGYATTFAAENGGEIGHPILFHPFTGSGPTLVVPCAIAFKIFGKNEVLPGLTAIFIWGGILTLVLARISRRINGLSFLLGVSVMCAAFLAIFSFHFEQWYAFLGEIVAAAFLILALWMISNERFSDRSSFLCGLAAGCAIQAKLLAALPATGIIVVFVVRGMHNSLRPVQLGKYAAALLIGFLIPTLSFEAYKLFQLGVHGYLANWQELLNAMKVGGLPSNTHLTLLLLRQRIGLVYQHFGVNLIGLLVLTAFGMLLYWHSTSNNWILLSVGLLLSVTITAVYWATLSIGWARYLVIAVALGVFVLSLPIFTLELWSKLLFAFLTLVLLRADFPRIGYIVHSVDHGLFRPTTERTARAALVRVIDQRKQDGPTILGSRWWGSFADVEFSLQGSMNFETIEKVSDLPKPNIVLLNHRFDPPQDVLIKKMRGQASSTIFAGGPYELLEVGQ
jgi:hypothetical protein